MARKVDITDKLTFDGNPILVIKGKELEVNADAPTVLRIMNLAADDPGPKEVAAIYNLIFPDKDRKEIEIIKAAISLVTGEETDQGEQ